VSFAYHAAMVVLMLLAFRYGADSTTSRVFARTAQQQHHMAERTGSRGGGGGGGNQMKEPPRQAELPGKDKLTVPVVKPPKLEAPKESKEPNTVVQLNIPAQTLAAATESLPGAIEPPPGPPAPTVSQGAGTGGGAGAAREVASDPERDRVWALDQVAARAAASIGPAAASRYRPSFAK
jgi:hypothetical protein